MNRSQHSIILAVTRAELRKFRRPSFLLTTYGAITALAMVIVAFAWMHAHSAAEAGQTQTMNLITGYQMSLFFLGVLCLCIAANHCAQEYSYGTLRVVLVRANSKNAFLVGKAISLVLYIFLLNAYTFLLSTVVSLFFSERYHMRLTAALPHQHFLKYALTGIEYLLCGFVGTCALGIFGSTLGLIVKSPALAISLGLLWSLIIESALGSALARVNPWLPCVNFESLATRASGVSALSYQHTWMMSTFYMTGFMVLAWVLFRRRDVSQ